MVKQRNVAVCIILTLLTCGIYGLYWMACVTNDINKIAGVNDTGGGMCVLLDIITCNIYGWYWAYKLGEKIDIINQKSGRPAGNNGILMIILMAIGLGFIVFCIAQSKINDIVAGSN